MPDYNEDGAVMQSDASTVALLNKSEIDQQIATAHKFPRSIKRFRQEALEMSTLTDKVAEECIYALPRYDSKTGQTKMIEGPSARLAEIVASAWGNCRAGARVISEEGDFIVAQGAFHDLERNVAITYEVKRRITNSAGKRFNADMISVTANAACSIALRNAILKGVPKAFWSDIYDAARLTAMGDSKTLANKRLEAIDYLKKLGATVDQICATVGVEGVEDIGLEELASLRGIATAIKEGETTVEQAFGFATVAKDQPAEQKKEKPKGMAGLKATVGAGKTETAPAAAADDVPQ